MTICRMAAANGNEVELDLGQKYQALDRPATSIPDLVVGQYYVENNGPGQRFPVFRVLERNPATGSVTIKYHSRENQEVQIPHTIRERRRTKYHLYLPPGAAAVAAPVAPPAAPAAVVVPAEHYLLTTANNKGTINVSDDTTNSISMNSFEEDQPVVRLNERAEHIFHRETLNKWFQQKPTNPLTGVAPTKVEVGRARIIKKGGARKNSKSKKQKQKKSKSKSRKH